MSRPRIARRAAPWDRNGVTTFRERYCAARGLRRDQFQADVFQRCLEPPARALAPLISLLWPNQFSADWDFILRVACSRTLREVNEEIHDFREDARNRCGSRGWAGPRISAERLQRLARAHLPTMAASARPAGCDAMRRNGDNCYHGDADRLRLRDNGAFPLRAPVDGGPNGKS